jgi:hypothetical protein
MFHCVQECKGEVFLVGANDDSDGANEEGTNKSVWCFCVGGHIGD